MIYVRNERPNLQQKEKHVVGKMNLQMLKIKTIMFLMIAYQVIMNKHIKH